MRLHLYIILFYVIAFINPAKTAAQCSTPTLSVFNIVSDSATLSWTSVAAATGYEYAVQPAASPAPASGTAISLLTIRVGGLMPGTAYKAWIRSVCSGGVFSPWGSISFSTPCGIPATVTVANIGADSADISWTSVSPTANYQYVVDTFSTIPTSGTNINTNSVRVKGLILNKTYYVFVRTDCGGGIYSAWSAAQVFYTPFATSVGNTLVVQNSLKAYPNPFDNNLAISGFSGKTKIIVTNMLGTIVYQTETSETITPLNLATEAPGIYFVKCISEKTHEVLKVEKR